MTTISKRVDAERLTVSGHLLEAYRALRTAMQEHTEPLSGYTANTRRDSALLAAERHVRAAREAIGH